jgi:hypothetical protein
VAIPQAAGVVGLRLVLEKRRSDTVFDDGPEYALKLVDLNDTEAMRFALPQSFVDDIRSDITDLDMFMSLDGTLSIVAPDSEHPLTSAYVGLDELVARDLAPEMLEDEPDAKDQLTVLRQRLEDALVLVDRTLADLDETDS